ncbi:MAG: toll/interleukin-1 receptor domain-containing protein [Verrucomicrobiaceae bacterium]|nr:toll/interleukin-1 receptor domain-containing protein [Verrucomicrobiaceae bacterium]
MPYDLFISYSRRDNEQGRITQLVERIKTDFAPFAKRELVPFFDQEEIHGMSDWRQRILQGLRESRLLLACLSPAYLRSEYFEWEFVEHLEIAHLHGFNGVALFGVPPSGGPDGVVPSVRPVPRKRGTPNLRKRQHFDLRPWHDQGEETLREAAVRERMGKLNRQIVQTITRGERAEKSLGNVDAHNPHFIGRTANLRMLRENFVKPGHIGVVTAVNGVGGLGKTARFSPRTDDWTLRTTPTPRRASPSSTTSSPCSNRNRTRPSSASSKPSSPALNFPCPATWPSRGTSSG